MDSKITPRMSNTRAAKTIFLLLFAISILLPLIYYNQLPERIASHFDFYNRADNWTSKSGYLIFHYVIIFFFFLIFGGMSYYAPRFPSSLINLPNKEYWLHESRREHTFSLLQAMLLWLGSVCLALFVYMFYEIFNANVSGSQQISSFSWVSVIVFIVANAIIVIKYILYFTNKENKLGEE